MIAEVDAKQNSDPSIPKEIADLIEIVKPERYIFVFDNYLMKPATFGQDYRVLVHFITRYDFEVIFCVGLAVQKTSHVSEVEHQQQKHLKMYQIFAINLKMTRETK